MENQGPEYEGVESARRRRGTAGRSRLGKQSLQEWKMDSMNGCIEIDLYERKWGETSTRNSAESVLTNVTDDVLLMHLGSGAQGDQPSDSGMYEETKKTVVLTGMDSWMRKEEEELLKAPWLLEESLEAPGEAVARIMRDDNNDTSNARSYSSREYSEKTHGGRKCNGKDVGCSLEQRPSSGFYTSDEEGHDVERPATDRLAQLARHFRRFPWCFENETIEKAYQEEERDPTFGDRSVALAWLSIFLAIIFRHRHNLPYITILKSSCHCFVTIGPLYWIKILGKERYRRYRNLILVLAVVSYTFHNGGGLYRDAVQTTETEHTGLGAFKLFIKVLISSRMLFWLILVLGYRMDPILAVPLNVICLSIMTRFRPPHAFCRSLHLGGNGPLFKIIAKNLPLMSIVPIQRPSFSEDGSDICVPLMTWMFVSVGFIFATCIQLAIDFAGRRAFVKRHRLLFTGTRSMFAVDEKLTPWLAAALVFVQGIAFAWVFIN